jgi:hypothetical protein
MISQQQTQFMLIKFAQKVVPQHPSFSVTPEMNK